MRTLVALVAVLPLACGGAAHVHRRAQPAEVTVHVVDEAGAPLADTTVELSIGFARNEECCLGFDWERTPVATTDARGTVVIAVPDDAWPDAAIATRGDWPPESAAITGATATIVLGPARTVAGHVTTHGCPARALRVALYPVNPGHDAELADELAVPAAITDGAGDFTAALGPGSYGAIVEACGAAGSVTLTGRDARIAIDVPARAPLAAQPPLAATPVPAPAPPACRFAASGQVLAGDFQSVSIDPWCRLLVVDTHGMATLLGPDGAVALGTVEGTPVFGEHVIAARVWERDHAVTRTVTFPGGIIVDRDEADVVTRAPHGDALAFVPVHDPEDSATLDVRLPDGHTRRVALDVVETVWTDDDRLAYVQAVDGVALLHVFDPADGSDTVVRGNAQEPGRTFEPVTLWATRDALVVLARGRLDRVALRDLARTTIADVATGDFVQVDRGAVTYLADGDRPWLWDATTGAHTELASLRGGEAAVALTRSATGELAVVGGGDLLVAAGRSPCDVVLAIAGDIALCRDATRTLAVPLDAPDRAVGLSATTLSFDGAWASGDGIIERTDGGAREPFAAAWGTWAPDRDVLYFLDDGALVARDPATARDAVVARSARAFAPLPGGGVAFAVAGDGVYVVASASNP